MTRVIAAFAASGKSDLERKIDNPEVVTDLDSSSFSWVIDSSGEKTRNTHFPANYIEEIRRRLGCVAFILASSNPVVLDALDGAGLDYTLVFPSKDQKEERLALCRNRGSSRGFVDNLDRIWDTLIEELETRDCPKIHLGPGQFLADVIDLTRT